MPSLGFLKKKRTREGNSDPSSSNPTSPVTPTSSTSFIRSASISRPFSSLLPRSSTTSTSSPVAASTAQTHAQAPASAGTAPQPQTQSHPHPSAPAHQTAATEAERQQMNSVNVLTPSYQAGSPNPHDPQNLPSISNLINPPQHDSAVNSYSNSNNSRSHSPYPIDSRSVQTASPGTTPALIQQQQQQALPQSTMQPAGQQQPARQPVQQPAYQQHQQQPSNGSQARITKGKYSLGDFDILRTLGTGSFGRVHLVQSKHNQRFYAVKVLKKAQVVKMKQVEHTNDERRMLSDVKHPFLITLWGTFQDLKNLYMVMDFVEGGELFSLLRKSGVRPVSFPPSPFTKLTCA